MYHNNAVTYMYVYVGDEGGKERGGEREDQNLEAMEGVSSAAQEGEGEGEGEAMEDRLSQLPERVREVLSPLLLQDRSVGQWVYVCLYVCVHAYLKCTCCAHVKNVVHVLATV